MIWLGKKLIVTIAMQRTSAVCGGTHPHWIFHAQKLDEFIHGGTRRLNNHLSIHILYYFRTPRNLSGVETTGSSESVAA